MLSSKCMCYHLNVFLTSKEIYMLQQTRLKTATVTIYSTSQCECGGLRTLLSQICLTLRKQCISYVIYG